MKIAQSAQLVLIELCKQLGVIAVMLVMTAIFMSVTSEIDAQTDLAKPATPAQLEQASVFEADAQLKLDLAEVKRSYRGQLEEYRTLHQQFVVAKQEFQQLGTLSSLEAAVQSTQKVLIMRDTVLLSYLKILEIETTLAENIEPSLQADMIFALGETQKSITRHLENTQASTDRAAIAQRTAEFEEIEELYSFVVAFSKQVLQLGELRSGHQNAEGVLLDLPTSLAGQDELYKAARLRALEQIALNLKDADALLSETELELRESLDKVSLVQTTNAFEEVYAILQRVVGFLDEVHVPNQGGTE